MNWQRSSLAFKYARLCFDIEKSSANIFGNSCSFAALKLLCVSVKA